MKNDKKNLSQQMGSIKTRLTLFYAVAAFVLLTVVALFLYWGTLHLLYKADYQFLSDEVDTIQYILEDKSIDMTALKQAVIDAPAEAHASIYRYYIRVFDDQKKLIIATPEITNILQTENSLHKSGEQLPKKRFLWFSKNDNDYLLIQAPIRLGPSKKIGQIQIALDISYQHKVIHDRKKLIEVLLAGTLCSLILGFLIANRGMRSLYLLIETAEKITVTSLHERINPNNWPKELRTLGKALNQMLDRMEASFLRLKQFSADLAHELRTPITNLIGQTEITLSYSPHSHDYKNVLESNLEELHRLSSIIENILFLARTENPQYDLQKAELNIHDEIGLICDFYQAMSEEKKINVSYQGKARLSANPDMFRRLISNVLSNALKYTPSGGWVRFNIHEIDERSVQIVVSDNGIGIASEHLPHIFNRFYRADTARSQESGGSGLGLAIVKSIVELHQGDIFISSELHKGTTIFLTFPT